MGCKYGMEGCAEASMQRVAIYINQPNEVMILSNGGGQGVS